MFSQARKKKKFILIIKNIKMTYYLDFRRCFPWISQNLRIVEVGTDLWRPSHPAPLLNHKYLEQVAQGYVQMAFEDLQGRRLHDLSGQYR